MAEPLALGGREDAAGRAATPRHPVRITAVAQPGALDAAQNDVEISYVPNGTGWAASACRLSGAHNVDVSSEFIVCDRS